MAMRAVFIRSDGRLPYERLLRRLHAKMRGKRTVYCICKIHFETKYGMLFIILFFAGDTTELEDTFSQFEIG